MPPIIFEQLTTLELTFCWLIGMFIFLLAIAVYSIFANEKGE